VQFDTVAMTMSVTLERLQELEVLLTQWADKTSTTKLACQESLFNPLEIGLRTPTKAI